MIPPTLLLGVFLAGGIFEYQANDWNAQRLASLQAAGRPINSQQLTQLIFDRSRKEGTPLWSEVLAHDLAASSHPLFARASRLETMLTARTPILSASEILEVTEMSLAEILDYLHHLRPLIDKWQLAAEAPQPIWTPQVFHPQTYARYRRISVHGALLNLEVALAIHDQERSRILEGLHQLRQTDALMGPQEYHSAFLRINSVKREYLLCRLCLSVPGWTQEELKELDRMVDQPADLTAEWRDFIDRARVDAVEFEQILFFDPSSASLVDPWVKSAALQSQWLQRIDQMERISIHELSRELGNLREFPSVLPVLTGPAMLENLAQGLSEMESQRKLTRCGIAVRRFKLEQQRWPRDLAELTSYLASTGEIPGVDSQQIGYEFTGDFPRIWIPLPSPIAQGRGRDPQDPDGPAAAPQVSKAPVLRGSSTEIRD
jgi:hypothetical protein